MKQRTTRSLRAVVRLRSLEDNLHQDVLAEAGDARRKAKAALDTASENCREALSTLDELSASGKLIDPHIYGLASDHIQSLELHARSTQEVLKRTSDAHEAATRAAVQTRKRLRASEKRAVHRASDLRRELENRTQLDGLDSWLTWKDRND